MAHDHACTFCPGVVGSLVAEEVDLVGALQTDVREEDTECGGAIERVEGVEGSTYLVAIGDLAFDIAPGRDEDLLAVADGEDVVDLYVFTQAVEQVNQGIVLYGCVLTAHDSETCASVLTNNGAVLVGDSGLAFMLVGTDALADLEVSTCSFEGFVRRKVLGDQCATCLRDEWIDLVAVFPVLAVDSSFLVTGKLLSDAVTGAWKNGHWIGERDKRTMPYP